MLAGCLAHHRLPAKLREALLADGLAAPGFDAATMLAQALGARFRFVPLALPAARPIAIVGLPGAGKTAVTARLAAQALVAGHAASVFTTDSGRAGGVAQLAALLRPLRLEPTPTAEPAQLAQALATTGTRSVALIDTAGINPFRAREVADLAEFVAAAMAEPVLVLPAGLDGADSVEIAANFAAIGARRMIVTRVDTARRLGSILSVADMGLAFAGAERRAGDRHRHHPADGGRACQGVAASGVGGEYAAAVVSARYTRRRASPPGASESAAHRTSLLLVEIPMVTD